MSASANGEHAMTSANDLWDSILANKVDAPKRVATATATATAIPDHWHQPPKDPSHYRKQGEWCKVETQLIISKTRCRYGCIFESPNRLMNLWHKENTTEQKWVALKPEEALGSAPRTLRVVEHSVDFCQHCFGTASSEGSCHD